MVLQNRKSMMAAANNGRIFYVDATSGNDTNDGLATNRAWQTITKVNSASLLPGDHVLFKKGETFSGRLIPAYSGVDSRWITFGAYGSGNRPIINGTASSALYIYTGNTSHHLRYENLDFYGAANGVGGTTSVCRIYTHDVYMYNCLIHNSNGVNPNDYIGLDAADWGGESDGRHIYNQTYENCEFYDNGRSGLFIGSGDGSAGPHDVLILNCKAYNNALGTSKEGHGFYVKYGVTVRNCQAYNNISMCGFKLNDNGVPNETYQAVMDSCYSYNNYVGIQSSNNGALIINNLVWDNHDANLDCNGGSNSKIYFNTFVNAHGGQGILFSEFAPTGCIFKNNLIIQDSAVNPGRICLHSTYSDLSGIITSNTFDYNIYYYSGNPAASNFCSPLSGASVSFNGWKAATGSPDNNSIMLTSLPNFVSRYTDFQPIENGNLLGVGVALPGYITDKNGVTRTNPPTPGCYDAPQPEPVAFASAEVGNITLATVAVTFSTNILSATNYSAGVTIKVNGNAATVNSATRQADTKVIYYVLSANVNEGDAVTWEYDADTGQLTNAAATYDLPTTSAQSVTNNVIDIVVNINHETGDLSAYTSTVTDGGNLSVAAGAALVGNYGLSCLINDQTAIYAQKTITTNTRGIIRGRFYLDPNTLTMGAGEAFYVLICNNSLQNEICHIILYYLSGYKIVGGMADDASSNQNIAAVAITDAPHYVEFKVTRATSATSNDGRFDLWIDGAAQTPKTGIDNYDRFNDFSSVRLGAVMGLDTGTSGTLYLDDLKVNVSGTQIGA